MPALVLLGAVVLVMALPKPDDPILEMIVTYCYIAILFVVLSVATHHYGWGS